MSKNPKISYSSNTRINSPISLAIAEALAELDVINHVKIYPGRVAASNLMSEDGKQRPITKTGHPDVVGVELLVDPATSVVQFYTITSAIKGAGELMVEKVIHATPVDWQVVVVMDWSEGFWEAMAARYPQLTVF